MRTKEEIMQWLSEQVWWVAFRNNIENHGNPMNPEHKRAQEFISEQIEKWDSYFIAYAFIWSNTNEGIRFWEWADMQYIDYIMYGEK